MARGSAEKLRTQWAEPPASPEIALATAVIAMALEDLRHKRFGAWTWWTQCDESLVFWCDILGLNAAEVKERALAGQTRKPSMRTHEGGYRRRGVQQQPDLDDIDEQLELGLGC